MRMVNVVPAASGRSGFPAVARAGWFWFGVVAAAASVISLLVAPVVGELVIGAAAAVALFVGIRRRRPGVRGPWLLLALAQSAAVLALLGWSLVFLATGQIPVPSVMDGVYLGSYLLFAAGLALFVRRRVGHSPWEGVLDASLVMTGAAAAVWLLVLAPYQHSSGMPPATLVTVLAYPMMDVLIGGILAWLVFTVGVRTPTMMLLVTSVVVQLAADIVNSAVIANGGTAEVNLVAYGGWDLSYVLLGMAALHPSMADTGDPRRARGVVASRGRVAVYLVLAVTSPLLAMATVLTDQDRHDFGDDLVWLLTGAGVAVLLVIRLTQIARLANDRAAVLDRQAAELDRSRQGLLRAHQRVAAMFETAPTGMVQLDRDGIVLGANSAFALFVGQPVDAVVGGRIGQFVHAEDVPHLLGKLREALGGAGRQNGEVRCVNARGGALWAEWVLSPLQTPDHELTAIMVIADRTESRRLEVELRHAQKLEAIGRLAAGVAHELNTPIQFIGDNVDFLGDGATKLLHAVNGDTSGAAADLELDYLTEEIPEAVRQTKDGVHRVATIVAALKSFAHRGGPVHQPADINNALSDTLAIARGELRHVSEVRTDLTQLPPVHCSVGDLNQVFLNLLVNAADAVAETQSPDRPGRITVRSRLDGEHVLIEISDTGPGIPADLRDTVFEPFFTTKPVGRGTGQGLALARNIVVDGHGGMIDFASDPAEGTTFTIRLPLVSDPASAEATTPTPMEMSHA